MKMIKKDDPRHAASRKVLDAMHEFFNLSRHKGAVQWIQDAEGMVVIFTRGEYREQLMANIEEATTRPDVEYFEMEDDPLESTL